MTASNHLLFSLSYNPVGLYWKEKSTSFMEWNCRLHNPRKKKSQSASAIRVKKKKCVEPLHKQTKGVTFFSHYSQLLTFSLPKKEIFSWTRPKSAGGKPSICWFSFSAARNTITQVKYVTFGFPFVFCLLPLLGTLNDTIRNTNFFVPLAAIIRENLDERP